MPSLHDGAVTEYDWRSGGLGLVLSLAGIAVVGYVLVRQFVTGYIEPWVFVLGLVALAAWLAAQFWRDQFWRGRRGGSQPQASAPELVSAAVMVLCGAVGSGPSDGLLIVLGAIGVLRFAAAHVVPIWVAGLVALVAITLIAVGSLTVTMTPLGLLALVGAVVLAFLGGLNRRQAQLAAERRQELLERTIAAREEHAKASLLEERQAVARDIHDVLAHSLGGLVIQLDAVEALLESGRTTDAATRVRDARSLAASGLADARRAVEALRESPDEATVTTRGLRRSLAELVDAHRGLGGTIDLVERGESDQPTGGSMRSDDAVAVRRALQEALSNARKHAPGEPVHVLVDWRDRGLVLEVRNRMAGVRGQDSAALAASGGGHGLTGMAERFDALEGGSISAAQCGDDFVVRAELAGVRR